MMAPTRAEKISARINGGTAPMVVGVLKGELVARAVGSQGGDRFFSLRPEMILGTYAPGITAQQIADDLAALKA